MPSISPRLFSLAFSRLVSYHIMSYLVSHSLTHDPVTIFPHHWCLWLLFRCYTYCYCGTFSQFSVNSSFFLLGRFTYYFICCLKNYQGSNQYTSRREEEFGDTPRT